MSANKYIAPVLIFIVLIASVFLVSSLALSEISGSPSINLMVIPSNCQGYVGDEFIFLAGIGFDHPIVFSIINFYVGGSLVGSDSYGGSGSCTWSPSKAGSFSAYASSDNWVWTDGNGHDSHGASISSGSITITVQGSVTVSNDPNSVQQSQITVDLGAVNPDAVVGGSPVFYSQTWNYEASTTGFPSGQSWTGCYVSLSASAWLGGNRDGRSYVKVDLYKDGSYMETENMRFDMLNIGFSVKLISLGTFYFQVHLHGFGFDSWSDKLAVKIVSAPPSAPASGAVALAQPASKPQTKVVITNVETGSKVVAVTNTTVPVPAGVYTVSGSDDTFAVVSKDVTVQSSVLSSILLSVFPTFSVPLQLYLYYVAVLLIVVIIATWAMLRKGGK